MKTPHKWRKYRAIPWLVCRCCGLVWLNNRVTRLAVRAGCEKE
jgi:hypothetical protein